MAAPDITTGPMAGQTVLVTGGTSGMGKATATGPDRDRVVRRRPFLKSPDQAASIYLACSPEVEGVTGTYFAGGKPKASRRSSYDTAAAARLWQISLDLTARTCPPLVPGSMPS